MNYKNAAVVIANEICNMLYNNVIEEVGVEPFEGWCENGSEDFFGDYNLTPAELNKVQSIMREVAPHIDAACFILQREMEKYQIN